jgi:hypothetical protein
MLRKSQARPEPELIQGQHYLEYEKQLCEVISHLERARYFGAGRLCQRLFEAIFVNRQPTPAHFLRIPEAYILLVLLVGESDKNRLAGLVLPRTAHEIAPPWVNADRALATGLGTLCTTPRVSTAGYLLRRFLTA